MDNLGSYLKSQREERGIAIEEIASITKIHVRSLEMMEHSEWKSLPPEPFIRGFLSAYSRYVGLDPKEVLEKYRKETHPIVDIPAAVVEVATTSVPPPPVFEEDSNTSEFQREEAEEKTLAYELPKSNHQWKIWAASACAVAILVILPILFKGNNNSTTVSQKAVGETTTTQEDKRESVQSLVSKAIPVPSAEAVKEKPAEKPIEVTKETPKESAKEIKVAVKETPKETTKEVPAQKERAVATTTTEASPVVAAATTTTPPAPEAAPSTGAHTITVTVKDKSWSKLVVDNKAPVQKILEAGTYTYSADEKIKIVLGNSTTAEVLYNGEKADGLKINGTTRQFVFPNNSRFPQDPIKRKVATPEKESDVNPDSGLIKEE